MEKRKQIKTGEEYQRDLMYEQGYWVADMQLTLFNAIKKYQQTNNLNRTELAEKLGFTRGYISQILNGNFDHKLSKLVSLFLAIGEAPLLSHENLEKYIEDDLMGQHLTPMIQRPNITINYITANANVYIDNDDDNFVAVVSRQETQVLNQ